MRQLISAALVAAATVSLALPAAAADVFDRNTMLGWRQQTGPAVVAYFRAPIGPTTFAAPMRAGLGLTGPRSYAAGSAPRYAQGPRLLDLAFNRSSAGAAWSVQLNAGSGVVWTNDKESLQPGQVNLMESGLSWVAAGALTAGLAAGTISFIEKD
jgi:hypothetical protein